MPQLLRPAGPLLGLGLLALLLAPLAEGGPGRKRKGKRAEAKADPTPVQVVAPPAEAEPFYDLPLPRSIAPLPEGLSSASAQGCAACHEPLVSDWRASAHAGAPSSHLLDATDIADEPACVSCHLPLQSQHAAEDATFALTLVHEGVTCAACHIHDGEVVGPRPPAGAPHAQGWRADLAEGRGCASCHQLTWPGAAQPLYDTWGEWSRSAWAAAGVSCVDCHLGPGAGTVGAGSDHHIRADLARALTVLVDLDRPVLERGAEPLGGTLTLLNTGAGHHVPSGSPWVSLQLTVQLVRPEAETPEDRDGPVLLTETLGRTVGDRPPWPVTEDTRLAAGQTRAWDLSAALPQERPADGWVLRVSLSDRRPDGTLSAPRMLQDLPLTVH